MTLTSRASLLVAAIISIGAAKTAEAQSLEGLWEFTWQAPDGTYAGTMEIDRHGQARLLGTTPRRDFSECGHARTTTGANVELVFTTASAGYNPDRFQCTAPTDLTLNCAIEDSVGKVGTGIFSRLRGGKASAGQAARLRSVECAPRVSQGGNGLKMGAGPPADFDRKRTVKAGEPDHARDAERA